MSSFKISQSAKHYLNGLKEHRDTPFKIGTEAYKVLTLGPLFYAYYKPEMSWSHRRLERAQILGRVKPEGKDEHRVMYRHYFGASLFETLFALLLVIGLLSYNHFADLSKSLILIALSIFIFGIIVYSIITTIYTTTTDDGKDAIENITDFVRSGGKRYGFLPEDDNEHRKMT